MVISRSETTNPTKNGNIFEVFKMLDEVASFNILFDRSFVVGSSTILIRFNTSINSRPDRGALMLVVSWVLDCGA